MTGKVCARLWQVEAVRDGRLAGNDLAHARRHFAECPDCAREERALTELGRQIRSIPEPAPAPLVLRRARQTLLGAWNEQLLEKREPKRALRFAWAAVLLVTGAAALVLGYPHGQPASPGGERSAPFFEVVAKPGTRWSARETPNMTRIELQDGFASFTVRRPSGQRLLVDVPDGEIEDLGTVFEVLVQEQHTVRVSVSQGRVFVRLKAVPAFELKAGQSWQPEPSAPPPPVGAKEPLVTHRVTPSASTVRPRRERGAPQLSADSAEDDAYLHIVDLLRNGHELEARAKAEQYLARFPNGFRRPEVAKIAQH